MLAYVINLPTSTARRTRVEAELTEAGMAYAIVPAVDGRTRAAADFGIYRGRACRIRHGRGLNGAEVACYLSHIQALRTFLEGEHDEALIMEDDAGIPPDAHVRAERVRDRLVTSGYDWDVANLTYTRKDYCLPLSVEDGVTLRHAFYFPMIACANLWSRKGAERFLGSIYGRAVRGPYDTELRSFLARTGGGISVDPPIFSHVGFESDIDSGPVQRFDASLGVTERRPVLPRLARHFPDYMHAHVRKALCRTGRQGA